MFEYWKVFSYLYFKKVSDKFAQINNRKYSSNLLKSISINNLFLKEEINNLQQKEIQNENGKEKPKDTISLNSFNSFNSNLINNKNSCFNSNINNDYSNLLQHEMKNFINPTQRQNLINSDPNYINHIMIPNSQNNNIINTYQPQNLSQFYQHPNLIQNNINYSKNYNNLDNSNNIPFIQMPFVNPNLQPLIPTNNIIATSIPNDFMLTNNNINNCANSDINLNFNNKNIINLNNCKKINEKKESNLISLPNKTGENNNKNSLLNSNENTINQSIKENPQKKIPEKNTKSPEIKPTINNNIVPKIHKVIFNIKESNPKNDLLTKKRKRFIKNNKLVFIQTEENESNLKNEKELDEEKSLEIQNNTKPRGSRFRGVSKNGSQWQVLIMVKKKKRYLGSFNNEEEAARIYDKVALQNHGNKAKTNYDYTQDEIEKIIKGPKLLKI